ncbi:MAG TPA: hypothetical protein VHW23_16860 [Kofleriaceae bacterium]|jgi:hypothetical protein|nr:hypothetical protein [Kofleriaceae bacterium]
MTVDALIDAIRAADGDAGDGPAAGDAELATATRLRVMRSLESRAGGRHQLIGFATAIAILLGGTVSWALATGEIAALWRPAPEPRPAAPAVAPPPSRRRPVSSPRQVPPAPPPEEMSVDPRPAQLPRPEPPEASPPAPPPVVAPRPPRRAAPTVEVLYRRAHELHFHGGDPAAALVAWDAYLAAEPDGRFSIEARYNRALMLVRLGRYAEARAALVPYARGEVMPAGYRQAEAEQLVERLGHYDGSQ